MKLITEQFAWQILEMLQDGTLQSNLRPEPGPQRETGEPETLWVCDEDLVEAAYSAALSHWKIS